MVFCQWCFWAHLVFSVCRLFVRVYYFPPPRDDDARLVREWRRLTRRACRRWREALLVWRAADGPYISGAVVGVHHCKPSTTVYHLPWYVRPTHSYIRYSLAFGFDDGTAAAAAWTVVDAVAAVVGAAAVTSSGPLLSTGAHDACSWSAAPIASITWRSASALSAPAASGEPSRQAATKSAYSPA